MLQSSGKMLEARYSLPSAVSPTSLHLFPCSIHTDVWKCFYLQEGRCQLYVALYSDLFLRVEHIVLSSQVLKMLLGSGRRYYLKARISTVWHFYLIKHQAFSSCCPHGHWKTLFSSRNKMSAKSCISRTLISSKKLHGHFPVLPNRLWNMLLSLGSKSFVEGHVLGGIFSQP